MQSNMEGLPVQKFHILLILCFSSATSQAQDEPRLTGKAWADMDYGPAMKFSVQVSEDNIAYKGLAVRLDPGPGGIASGNTFMVFDTDTLRWAGGWTSDTFIDWRGIAMNGEHEIHPSVTGDVLFTNPVAPGWGHPIDGRFTDGRVEGRDGKHYGPMARDWGRWNGHYLQGDKVVLSYTIGGTEILETPRSEGDDDAPILVRTLNVGPRSNDLALQIMSAESVELFETFGAELSTKLDGKERKKWVITESSAETELVSQDKQLRLKIPAGDSPISVTIAIFSKELAAGPLSRTTEFADLKPLTTGGPRRWTETLTTSGALGKDDEAYTIDTIQHPVNNPYRSWMRFTGFAFFEDDSQAVISTWNGDIWHVSGIDETLQELKWRRIASGMFQPLGIVIRDGDIYAICRDQITILRDLNGDGETDFYENFNSDHQVTEHFHEFALDLKLGIDGDFYYTKGGRHGADSITPNHGTLIRVSADGTESEFVANGFRAPNGLGLGPQGEMLVADNQGHWIPANRINWVEPGGFYGYMWGYRESQNITGYDEPLMWIHPSVDRSPGTFTWVPDNRWGPFKDRIISNSYGMGQMFHVMHEEIGGIRQGGVVKFPLDFKTGTTRAMFRKSDGQLYTAGLFGWAGNKTQPGGFYRVRYTGQPVNMPTDINIASDGVAITFTDPLDEESATDPGNYAIKRWDYKWTAEYGSDDYKLNGDEGRDTLRANEATLSKDGLTLYLEIPDIQPVMQMDIQTRIKSKDGTRIRRQIHHTIHTLGKKSVQEMAGTGGELVTGGGDDSFSITPGLTLTINSNETTDTRASRLVALYVSDDEAPTPFLNPGPFTAVWSGFIDIDLNDDFIFSTQGNGNASLRIDDEEIAWGEETELKQGLNRFNLTYTSPTSGPAEFRLYWESYDFFREPLPPTVFRHDTNNPELKRGSQLRLGRKAAAEYHCFACHGDVESFGEFAMPELLAKAPSLDDLGDRFRTQWIVDWILDPDSMDPYATMPKVDLGRNSDVARRGVATILGRTLGFHDGQLEIANYSKKEIADGKTQMTTLGCMACHTLPGENADPDRRSLAHVAAKWKFDGLEKFLEVPSRWNPHSSMPNFSLNKKEIRSISAYLLSQSTPPPARQRPLNDHVDPAWVEKVGCVNCHEVKGLMPGVRAADLASIPEKSFNRGCLSPTVGQRGNAPEFALTPDERTAIAVFLKDHTLQDSLSNAIPAEYAKRQLVSKNCTACHERDGVGDLWSQFAQNPESAEDSIHVGRPSLTYAGEKLRTDWLVSLLEGTLDHKSRPGLTERMPHFNIDAELFARGLAAQHGFGPESAESSGPDIELAKIGAELALSEERFRCNACHGVGKEKPLAGSDTETINFADIPSRLRQDFFHRFTKDPQRILPGTQMPSFVNDNGSGTITDILDGDAHEQFQSIWEYMRTIHQN